MKIIKSIAVAFSMYSKIPMPKFAWGGEDMKYHFIFFPWLGAVIGCLEYLLLRVFSMVLLPKYAFAALAMLLPLLVTGGFHVDGFMDTEDALSAWKTKEERLEILKDPHIGAFSVIRLVMAGLVLFASLCVMDRNDAERASGKPDIYIKEYASTSYSGQVSNVIAMMLFAIKAKKAKTEGLLHTEAETAGGNAVFFSLLAELFLCIGFAVYTHPLYGTVQGAVALFMTVFYLRKADRFFGGITGDLAGWFVVVTEVATAATVGIIGVIG